MRSHLICIAVLSLCSCVLADTAAPVHLFADKGVPAGWVMGTVKDVGKAPPPEARWFVNEQVILTGEHTYDTWLMSEKEYGDFELELEFQVSVLGNSGVALRAPLHGDPAYEAMELQIVDPRYYEGHGAPEQLCGAIYRAIPPKKQLFKPQAWNRYQITCQGAHVKVVLNDEVIQDFNLDEQTATLHRDDPKKSSPPLKDRPRSGHIGFQDLCRDGGHTQIRNVHLRELGPGPTTRADALQVRKNEIVFDNDAALADWKLAGGAAIDPAKAHGPKSGALKIPPGARATLKLRDRDASGKVEFWIYDDGTTPADAKVHRVGPRWGLAQSDGRVFTAGIFYASYLGGSQGYTASASNGKDWFDQLFWLATDRAPTGWHKWTFNFDADQGLQLLHNDKPINVSFEKSGMRGFDSIVFYGDDGSERPQTIWLADARVQLGGPVQVPQAAEADPYDAKAVAADTSLTHPPQIYAKENAPATPALESLSLKGSVSQYGITWTFQTPAHVGQFINGDWYVVGPVTISQIDPRPLHGSEIPANQLDHMDRERPEAERVRNGFMLNPPARMKVAYDSGVRNYFDPSLVQKLPIAMKPGDSLVATISMPKGLVLHAPLRNKISRGDEDSSPIRTAAVLTCVEGPQPPDAFRPAFCDRSQKLYRARNLRRDLLPAAARSGKMPDISQYVRFTQRPWVGTCFFGFEEPVENMPQYGLEYGRVSGMAALLLCTDLTPREKEPLLINFVQVGIDLGGMIRSGHPGWTGWGGHGSGRKLPIVLAGLLLEDQELANINKSFPSASFGEDEQTAYGDGWTGAKVVFAGHSGIDTATGIGRNIGRGEAWGPYEQLPPAQWRGGQNTSESYRRCCTSIGWIGQTLALRLLHAEPAWNHDAFFDYADRWMYENDAEFVKQIKAATGKDFSPEWARQGQCWDEFAGDMWSKHRRELVAPTDGWRQPHDETYYKRAIELEHQGAPKR